MSIITAGARTRVHWIAARGSACLAVSVMLAAAATVARAQAGPAPHDTISVAALVARAQQVNPAIAAAHGRVNAARARIGPAGVLPDPMLMLGIQNLPLGTMRTGSDAAMGSGGPDPMRMKMIGVQQNIPYRGKLTLGRRAAMREVEAAEAALLVTEWQVTSEVQAVYYELVFLDRALDLVQHNHRVLSDLVAVTETRYGVGTAPQQDVLRARIEATRLAESTVALRERRHAALARLNALLDRKIETPVSNPVLPTRVARAAVADSASHIQFVSAELGARAAGSPLPPLGQLQERAAARAPAIREQEAMVAAQRERLALSQREYLPDLDVSLQYGQRTGYPDMLTATVGIPIPIQKRRRQDQLVMEARAELVALEAERHARRNDIRAEVARLYSELERQRAQLALYVKAIIPQGRALLASVTGSYQVGRAEFRAVLENQATLFNHETEYFRTLTDFATTLALLERAVGEAILP